jgi:pyruvate dehydrogenase E1 component
VPSPDRLFQDWSHARLARSQGEHGARAHIGTLLADLAPACAIVTVVDGHPATLSWLGSVRGHRVSPLGVDHFGQSGDINDLYRAYRIDTDAILDACAAACLER